MNFYTFVQLGQGSVNLTIHIVHVYNGVWLIHTTHTKARDELGKIQEDPTTNFCKLR